MECLQSRKADGTHTAVIRLAGFITGIDGWASIDQLQGCATNPNHKQQALIPIDRDVGPFSAGANLYVFAEGCLRVKIFAVAWKQL